MTKLIMVMMMTLFSLTVFAGEDIGENVVKEDCNDKEVSSSSVIKTDAPAVAPADNTKSGATAEKIEEKN